MEIPEKLKASIERQIKNPDFDKIKAAAEERRKLLNNIVSIEGAIHIVVPELYPEANYKASLAESGSGGIKGRLIHKTKPRLVGEKNQPVRDVFIATEESGVLKGQLWGKSKVELFKTIEYNDPIFIEGVKIGSKDGDTVLTFYDNANVKKMKETDVKALFEILKPIKVDEVKISKVGIAEGIVIQADDREYKTCPACGDRLSEIEDKFICKVHQEVQPQINTASILTIDTGAGVISTALWPGTLDESRKPKQLQKITATCRVYDANHYKREKARDASDGDTSDEVLLKQFPVQKKMTIYSYELEDTSASKATSAANSQATEQTQVETESVAEDPAPMKADDIPPAPAKE